MDMGLVSEYGVEKASYGHTNNLPITHGELKTRNFHAHICPLPTKIIYLYLSKLE